MEIKKISDTEIEISAEIPTEKFESYHAEALRHLSAELQIPGFRKGHIPEAVLVGKVGDGVILQEMAEAAIAEAYPEILSAEKVRAIGRPAITLTKLARGNPLGFRAKTAVLPLVALPDYKKIAAKIYGGGGEPVFVSDEETEKMLTEIRKNWEKTEKRGTDAEEKNAEQTQKKEEQKIPNLTDEFAQKLGNFKTVTELRLKIKENLKEEKTAQQKEKKRIMLIDELLKETNLPVPEVLIDAEKEKILAQFKGNLVEMGLRPEDYFKKLGKTEDEMKKEWNEAAKKRVQVQFIVSEIAEKEAISPDEKEVAQGADRIVKQYADADPARAKAYVEGILMNEAVFSFLEKQGKIQN